MSLLKSAALVGGLTLVSRVLGFVRDMLTASVVGTGPVAQAFVIAFPYLLFMSLNALQGGILNSLRRFSAAASAPILLNIVMIVTLLFVQAKGWGDSQITGYALAWGICAAGIAQFLLLMIACRRAN